MRRCEVIDVGRTSRKEFRGQKRIMCCCVDVVCAVVDDCVLFGILKRICSNNSGPTIPGQQIRSFQLTKLPKTTDLL